VKTCAVCGKRLAADELRIYSKWTRNYYCFDMAACRRRAKRRGRRSAAPLALP